MSVLLFLGWWAIGTTSMLYWISKVGDVSVGDILGCLACGLMGPGAFVFGWLFLGEELGWTKKIVFKQRIGK